VSFPYTEHDSEKSSTQSFIFTSGMSIKSVAINKSMQADWATKCDENKITGIVITDQQRELYIMLHIVKSPVTVTNLQSFKFIIDIL